MRIPRGQLWIEGTLVVVALLLLVALDWAFLSAYMTKWVGRPKHGLASWGGGPQAFERDGAVDEIKVQNAASISALLLALLVARRLSLKKGGLMVAVAFVVLLPLLLVSFLSLGFMLNVIVNNGPPPG
jgi:hypothetical protein